MKHRSKDLRDRATDLKDQLAPHVEQAVGKAGPALADAREKAAPLVAEARDKAAPYVADARGKTAPVVAEARDRWQREVAPALGAAVAAADEATADYRAEAVRRGAATAAALRGEVDVTPPKKKGRKRKVLLLLGLAGLGFAAVKKFTGQDSQAWESSYQPTPPTPAPVPTHTNDSAAATPDEALADAVEAPHAASTPEQPADSVDVDMPTDPGAHRA
ncbi:MAG: hypothetical protein Q8Q02_12225 [Nocardioides sp.]|nr:hypothetical protein [Nocardioides sp.]